jgi:hypothetical protein
MSFFSVSKKNVFLLLPATQLLLLLCYLTFNIENVGEMGTALPLLATFVALAACLFFIRLLSMILILRLHLLIFLMFLLWVALRIVIDLGDFEHLKQITIATTGGILLFFLIGSFSRQAINSLTESSVSNLYPKLLLVAFTLLCFFIFMSFKNKLLERTDIFFISGVDGGYQRPGNFLIVMFIIASFSYLSVAASFKTKGIYRLAIWAGIYTLGMAVALISSQMVGSNAATANLLAIYLMTIVISFLAVSTEIRQRFMQGNLALPMSKSTIKKIIKYSIVSLINLLLLSIAVIQVTNFDLSTTRAFGFGSGENNSINSRFKILQEVGAEQMGYAPFLGNANVAELTTGIAGKTLHNFLPNVMAELGLVGFFLILLLFFLSFRTLKNTIERSPKSPQGFKISILNFWLFFMLLFLFLYANLSVGKSWPVMWFFVGFAVNVFVFKKKEGFN